MTLHTGSHGHYNWLTSEDHQLADLMAGCPETVLGKYIAVTSIDSAALEVTEEEKAAGWICFRIAARVPSRSVCRI